MFEIIISYLYIQNVPGSLELMGYYINTKYMYIEIYANAEKLGAQNQKF